MGLSDFFKKALNKASESALNAMIQIGGARQMKVYMEQPSWWNPNEGDVFDADWAFKHLCEFMNEFTHNPFQLQLNTNYGLIAFGFSYNNEHYQVNFAPHNPRVLTLSLIDIMPFNQDEAGNPIPFTDNSTLIQFLEVANQYNKFDSRHIVRVGVLGDGISPVIRISSQVVFTDSYGDKMLIKEACDELLIYGIQFVKNAFKGKIPTTNVVFQTGQFLPFEENVGAPVDFSVVENRNDALGYWFTGRISNQYGLNEIKETEESYIRTVPITWELAEYENPNVLSIFLPGHNYAPQEVQFSKKEINQIIVRVPKEYPYIYTIEANNIKKMLELSKNTHDKLTKDVIRDICMAGNWNDDNQLVKFIWDNMPDGSYDFSIIASGIYAGAPQTFSRVQNIGEFMKNLAMAQLAINNVAAQ